MTFAADDGDEAGVPHTFFNAATLRAMLEDDWIVESLAEHAVDEIAGDWAHREKPLEGSAHFFGVLRTREPV